MIFTIKYTQWLSQRFGLDKKPCENEKSRGWSLSPAQDGDYRAKQTDNEQTEDGQDGREPAG